MDGDSPVMTDGERRAYRYVQAPQVQGLSGMKNSWSNDSLFSYAGAGGSRAGSAVVTARTPGAVPLDAGPGQTVLSFGTQMVLVAEVVVALACGIALPLPLGGTGGRPDGGRRLPDRAGRGGHTGDGGRERAAFCGHLRGEGGSDAQKAEDGQQAERLAIHDGTSWRGTEGEEETFYPTR